MRHVVPSPELSTETTSESVRGRGIACMTSPACAFASSLRNDPAVP
jgi:hypothetical protein